MPLIYKILQTLKLLLREHNVSLVVADPGSARDGANHKVLLLPLRLSVRMV